MLKKPTVSIVTPNYNQAQFIEQTLLSVINQDYPNIEYIVIDGGSNDGSIDIIKKYEKYLTYWETSPDKGMYDAINKGFKRASGDIMCWINSDDILVSSAIKEVVGLMDKNPYVHWLMGYPTIINEKSEITWQGQDAQVFSPYFFYLHNHTRDFSFIQQESTFWTRSLWERAGARLNLEYTLAADFDLWMRFFKHDKLYFTHQQLGAFRRRKGQQSENQESYLQETNLAISNNQEKLLIKQRCVIFLLKSVRKLFFSLKNKKIRNAYYKLQLKIFGKPNWID
ncbi:glycosyltransferase family 2 protein [Flavivirga algicola]|uniref:Glycosyltransferase n=1 Tax=Flavivirga algicola TaxID=2729136 RepID=A0ABX1RS29_9FLAO|nr:glycosyltransferase family 2 protein [Flavivirga algicola]NMH86355.1 glycosyltransferase [Flavivirga algicola]